MNNILCLLAIVFLAFSSQAKSASILEFGGPDYVSQGQSYSLTEADYSIYSISWFPSQGWQTTTADIFFDRIDQSKPNWVLSLDFLPDSPPVVGTFQHTYDYQGEGQGSGPWVNLYDDAGHQALFWFETDITIHQIDFDVNGNIENLVMDFSLVEYGSNRHEDGHIDFHSVPEPSALALALLPFFGLILRKR